MIINPLSPLPAWLQVEAFALIVIGAVACFLFIGLYSWEHKWWSNPFGRHLISISASLGALLAYTALVIVWPDLPGRVWVRFVLFHLLIAAMVWRLVVFGRYEMARKQDLPDE